jgi:hypothetical protein
MIEAGVESGVFLTPFPGDARRSVLSTLNAIPNWFKDGGDITVEMLVQRYQRLALLIVEFSGNITAAVGPPPAALNTRRRRHG